MPARRCLASLLAAAVALACLGAPAHAADESGMRQFQVEDALRRQGIVPERAARPARQPDAGGAASSAPVSASIGQQRTYCVRTCDGYYFAIGFARNKCQLAEHQSMCAASCGDAAMKLFAAPLTADENAGRTGPAIERAVDDTGSLYSAMPTAYAFKTADTSACACQSTSNGLPQIPISIDPTLRDGDIIVMADGLKVFRGKTVAPHADDDFVAVASAKSLPTVVRQQMLSLQNRISQ
jgi:hypothetical protein